MDGVQYVCVHPFVLTLCEYMKGVKYWPPHQKHWDDSCNASAITQRLLSLTPAAAVASPGFCGLSALNVLHQKKAGFTLFFIFPFFPLFIRSLTLSNGCFGSQWLALFLHILARLINLGEKNDLCSNFTKDHQNLIKLGSYFVGDHLEETSLILEYVYRYFS